MSSEIPIKITSGKRKRMVPSTDFIAETLGGTGETTFTRGDILAGDVSNGLTRLSLGTSGYVLTSNGTDATWAVASTATETSALTNDEAGALIVGNAVYPDAAAGVKKAKADSSTTSKVIGLSLTATSAAGSATIQTSGTVTLTTGQWDAVAGTTGGLTFGTSYYLSAATAGLLTSTAPNTTGQELMLIGVALSTTALKLQLDGPDTL